jgi:ferredoxin
MSAKIIVYWFSGTGNSLAIARDLAAALGETELVPLAQVSGGSIPVAEKTGFVFPVYAFGLPGIVREFLRKLPVNPGAYYFSVANCAGMAGAPHRQIHRLLQAKGARLAAGWTLFMPTNYPVLTDAWPEDKQQRSFDQMKERLPEIAGAIRQGQTGPFEDSTAPFRWLAPLVNAFVVRQFHAADKNFIVEDTCRQCGLCAKVCQVADIKLVDKRPTWLRHCEQCMACLQWCPAQAIQYGKATKSRKRYRHPQAKAKDLMLRNDSVVG